MISSQYIKFHNIRRSIFQNINLSLISRTTKQYSSINSINTFNMNSIQSSFVCKSQLKGKKLNILRQSQCEIHGSS